MKHAEVTVIIPIYNVETVVRGVLESVYAQTYPIHEIILIDNHSADRSVDVVQSFFQKRKKIPYRLIRRKKTYGLSDSYNLGADLSKTAYIVTLHSDSFLPGPSELTKLMKPFNSADSAMYVASIPVVVHRMHEWNQYSYWQKCLFAQVVGKSSWSLNGKFDAYKKDVYVKIGGYDTASFNNETGSEDADMHFRLKKQGEIAKTTANVVHAHGMNPNYSLSDWIRRRKFLARTYAVQLRLHWREMGTGGVLVFFIKPALVVLSIASILHPVFLLPVLVFPFVYMRPIFMSKLTRRDIRSIAVPFIVVYLIFAESVWMLRSLFSEEYRV